MKKTYTIYKKTDLYDEELFIAFDKKEEADEFCRLKNLPYYPKEIYFARENKNYLSISDFVKNNKKSYVQILLNAIQSLEYRVYAIESNTEKFSIPFTNYKAVIRFDLSMQEIKSLISENKVLNKKIHVKNMQIVLTEKIITRLFNDINIS